LDFLQQHLLWKVNLVGTLLGQRENFPVVFKSAVKNKRKVEKKQVFTQILFSRKSILVFGATLKEMTVGKLHFD